LFDFRYHALSLAAVLIALVVGLLLGVAIGDSNLVSSAEQKFRDDLRSDVERADRRADRLSADLENARNDAAEFEGEVYPLLVADRLAGARVGLVFLGRPSDEIAGRVRDALAGTGGRLAFVGVVREPLDLGGLAERAAGTRYARLDRDAKLVEPFGLRIGVQLAAGGQLVREVRPSLLRSFNGSLRPLDAIVVVRRSPDLEGDAAEARDAFEDGLLRGMNGANVPVVGAELSSTEPSQVRWYRDHRLSSVDSIDTVAGRAALVFTLQGAHGAFGTKDTADALLPNVAGDGSP
jgi:hypothetical protein